LVPENPIAKASAANIGSGITQLTFDTVALPFGISVARVPGTVRRNVLVLDDRIAERSSLSDRRGAGDNGQEIAPIDLCVSYGSLLSRCDRACADVCCLAFSCWYRKNSSWSCRVTSSLRRR